MPSRKPPTPSYRLHKASGRAVVSIDGRDFDLGLHGSDESRAVHDRLIAEWLANGRRIPADDDHDRGTGRGSPHRRLGGAAQPQLVGLLPTAVDRPDRQEAESTPVG